MKPLLALLVALTILPHAPAQNHPNIVLIVADDLGYADLAFLPQAPADVEKFGTPGFDRLAATGTYFHNAYGASPICSPSRAGLITGRYQQRWGNYWYGEGGLPQDELTIPEALAAAGYTTAKFGKTHLNGGPKEFPTRHGFDQFLGFMHHTWDYIRLSGRDVAAYKSRPSFKSFGNAQVLGPLLKASSRGTTRENATATSFEDGFTTRIFTDEAVRFIRGEKQDKPFYLHIAHNAVHMPTYIVEPSWAKKVGARHVPWDRDAPRWGFPYWEPEEEPNKVFHQKWGHMGEIDTDGRRCYLANLLALDHSVTRVLDALEETGKRDNTLVVFVSDNGGTINTYANNTPLRGWKYMFGEGGIRIPFLISMPGTLPQGAADQSAIVSTMDIFPTIAELARVPVPDNLDGKSLLPLLRGERSTHHETLAWAKSRDEWVIRHGRWKLTNNVPWYHRDFKILPNGDAVDAGQDFTYPGEPQLFDLENDISESTNLITQHPDIATRLRSLYNQWDGQMAGPMTNKGKPKKPKRKKQ
ncbi:MAG: sulfatase-like hydrolase/transferase [Verrucomicrobiales bacterium]|nr:sulfatase-like hydrolase/transferase [Verrucomicrobiales bacterium]